jgi:hypothetical protein
MEYGLAVYKNDGYGENQYVYSGYDSYSSTYVSYMEDGYVGFVDEVDSTGTPVFTTNDIAWVVLDKFYVSGGVTVTKDYPDFSDWNIRTFIMYREDPPPESEPRAPVVTIDGTRVTVGPDGSGTAENMDVLVIARNGTAYDFSTVIEATSNDSTGNIEASYTYFFTIADDLNTEMEATGLIPLGYLDPDWNEYYDPSSEEHLQYLYLLQDLGMPYIVYANN